jgi:ubiquinone/menaquinone biosynthesis C-methylase UbiE
MGTRDSRRYVPALRFHLLTRAYDPAVRWTTREATFKRRLLDQAAPAAGARVLDLGCGTGTLALMLKRRQPRSDVAGLDPDPEILQRARAKTREAGLDIRLDQGFSTELPYGDDEFDVVLSTLVLHHLTGAEKRRTASEIARVLRPGGTLHVADWGRASDPLMRLLFLPVRLGDGLEQTRDNAAGRLPEIFAGAGLEQAMETERLRTPFGTLALYRARKPMA